MSAAAKIRTAEATAIDGLNVADHWALQAAQLASFGEHLPSYFDAPAWPRERLARERKLRLRALIAVAKSSSAWHRERLSNVDAETFSESDLASIPTMNKRDLMANFDAIVTDRDVRLAAAQEHVANLRSDAYFIGNRHAVMSSGTTGTKGIFVFGWQDWIAFGLSSARPIAQMLAASPPGTNRHAVAFLGSQVMYASSAFAQSFAPWIVRQFETFTPLPMDMPIDNLVEVLNRIQPTCLSGYPSFIAELAHEAGRGALNISPHAVLVGGETLSRDQQALIEDAFGAQVFNFYGCAEASCLAFSCPKTNCLHTYDDSVIIEALDAQGRPVAPGQRADRLLITNLANTLMPLIRYELNDTIVLGDAAAPCECGSSFGRIESIFGRANDTFRYGNIAVHPFALSSVMDADADVLQYQVRQTPGGADISVRSLPSCNLQAIKCFSEDVLRARGVALPEISVARVARIERGPTGKLQRFVPLRKAT